MAVRKLGQIVATVSQSFSRYAGTRISTVAAIISTAVEAIRSALGRPTPAQSQAQTNSPSSHRAANGRPAPASSGTAQAAAGHRSALGLPLAISATIATAIANVATIAFRSTFGRLWAAPLTQTVRQALGRPLSAIGIAATDTQATRQALGRAESLTALGQTQATGRRSPLGRPVTLATAIVSAIANIGELAFAATIGRLWAAPLAQSIRHAIGRPFTAGGITGTDTPATRDALGLPDSLTSLGQSQASARRAARGLLEEAVTRPTADTLAALRQAYGTPEAAASAILSTAISLGYVNNDFTGTNNSYAGQSNNSVTP